MVLDILQLERARAVNSMLGGRRTQANYMTPENRHFLETL